MEENKDLLFGADEQTTELNAEVEETTTEQTTKQSSEESKEEKLNPYEEIILAEMRSRAEGGDALLAKALQSKDKTIKECFKYVTAQAKKNAVGNCAMIADTEVYAWAHHYYIESKETIDAEMKPKPKELSKTASKSANKGKTEEKKVHTNPLLEAIAKAQEDKKKSNGSAEQGTSTNKTFTKVEKNGEVSTTSVKTEENGQRTTTINKGGQTYTMTELSLF